MNISDEYINSKNMNIVCSLVLFLGYPSAWTPHVNTAAI